MLAHIFRDFNYKPAPVTSISSNSDIMVAFRRNKTFDLIDLLSNRIFLRYEINYIITQSEFINKNTVLCLTKCNKIALIDIKMLSIDILPYDANNISNISFETIKNFYFTSLNNELFEFKDNSLVQIVKENSIITTVLATNNNTVLYGNGNGSIKRYRDGIMIGQIETGSKVNKITHVCGKKFACALENGSGVLFDIENGIILDKILIRDTPLFTCVYTNDIVHFSGVDSRIIAFVIKNDKFIKLTQADYHMSDVLCMIKHEGYVITAGEDSIIILNELISGRYVHKRIYENSIIYKKSDNSIMIGNDEYIGIIYIKNVTDVDKQSNEIAYNDKKKTDNINDNFVLESINIKNDNLVLESSNINNDNGVMNHFVRKGNKSIEKIGVSGCIEDILFAVPPIVYTRANSKKTDYEFKLKFKIGSRLLSAAVSGDERYFAYSNNKTCYLFENTESTIVKSRTFGPAKQILFTKKFLILFQFSYKILFFDLCSLKTVFEISYVNFREFGAICENKLYLGFSKKIIDLSDNFKISDLEINGCLLDMSVKDDKPVFFVRDNNGDHKLILNSENIINIEEKNILKLSSNVLFNDKEIMLYEEKCKKYKIGHFIYGVIEINGEIIILHIPLNRFKSLIKPSVFKSKYSN